MKHSCAIDPAKHKLCTCFSPVLGQVRFQPELQMFSKKGIRNKQTVCFHFCEGKRKNQSFSQLIQTQFSPNLVIINLRSGSIFVSLCNNIPAGKAKRKQLGLISGQVIIQCLMKSCPVDSKVLRESRHTRCKGILGDFVYPVTRCRSLLYLAQAPSNVSFFFHKT